MNASTYFLQERIARTVRATLSILVDNEVGALARVVGLFAGRGYNIESLAVAETDHQKHTSRITIVTSGTPQIIEQIKAQLGRLVPVHSVVDLSVDTPGIEREMVLIKVRCNGELRAECLRLVEVFRARVIDITHDSLVLELTGNNSKVERFIELLVPLGLVELGRSGVVALSRGAEPTAVD
ncbi:acetolactate synthase small subunit [Pseudomarimonas arenosa]|uniref:Acetolactate synthase small subunit n=1 Tax=Pseudomarimonas arenosa TaxID=2774145 RepID=A0AAW3ZGS1_9GAMM|nr:acetolactate synthase small subunit [Pseudomarimonas arenosa]MBD8524207.1 acetolactate synthase small subunit [Pseudomarimonas arenosa]